MKKGRGLTVHPYPHMLSPLIIGNKVLKSRLMSTDIQPNYLQGPENHPTEAVMDYYAGIAADGAAIVTCRCGGLRDRLPRRETPAPFQHRRHFPDYDIYDPPAQNYFSQLADCIHFHDSLASVSLEMAIPQQYAVSAVDPALAAALGGGMSLPAEKIITREEIRSVADALAEQAALYRDVGFDACELHLSYRAFFLSAALSPLYNRRTDEYGGSFENRIRMVLELCETIKRRCGTDFLVTAHISREEPEPGGYGLEDVICFARRAEGLIDLLQIRGRDLLEAHPTTFNSEKNRPATLEAAAAVKASGVKMKIAACGGFQDPAVIEESIASGKTDLVAMARAFYCNAGTYYRYLLQGRGEDLVPCIRCFKCGGRSLPGTYLNRCSVNPEMGLSAARRQSLIRPPERAKRVAVIGGGPAGMQAALTLRARGHSVTLFEQESSLGGQLRHADHADFKWCVRDYKDYLIRQVQKQGVALRLGARARPEDIRPEGFDAVIAALGARPRRPDIPGVRDARIWTAPAVFGRSGELGQHVVVVGGSETGTETGLYLARTGHRVTVLTRQETLAGDAAAFLHYGSNLRRFLEETEGLTAVTGAVTRAVAPDAVTYEDRQGKRHVLACDSVVLSAGAEPLREEALAFYGTCPEFFLIGDAREPGSILTSTRSAFAAASRI